MNTNGNGFTKVLQPGSIIIDGCTARIFIKIQFEYGRLSITGVEGPTPNGNAIGSAGQIIGGFREYDGRSYKQLSDIHIADGWNADTVRALFDAWDRWHLNDMRAGCEHQRADGWSERRIDPDKPTTDYGKHFDGQKYDSWNLLGWVSPNEHPDGLLGRPCEVCGYKYGTAWRREEVPEDVIEFLRSLPDSPVTPAWDSSRGMSRKR